MMTLHEAKKKVNFTLEKIMQEILFFITTQKVGTLGGIFCGSLPCRKLYHWAENYVHHYSAENCSTRQEILYFIKMQKFELLC